MAARSRNDRLGNYVLLGSAGLLLVAVAAVGFVFLREGSAPVDLAGTNPPTSTKAPAANSVPRAENKPTPVSASLEKPIVVSSEDLRQQYETNELIADQKYKDKLLEVTGIVAAVYQESPLIGIGLGRPQDPMPSVLCEMDRQQVDLLSKVRRGQSITLRGTGKGKLQEGFLGIGNCRIVPAPGLPSHP